MKKSRLIIMDIIIVILVVLNAAMIIAVAENYNDENRTYNTRWFMNLYKNDEYGRAVDYASRDKIVIDNIQDNELDESIAVAEYYNAEFYKNVGSIIFFVGLTLPRYSFSKPSASLDRNLRQCLW